MQYEILEDEYVGLRIDKYLNEINEDYTRSFVQKMIEEGLASGFMFKHLIQPEMDIKTFSMQPPIYVKVSLVWNAKAKLFRSMKKLISFMKKS